MAEFTTTAALEVEVDQRSLRSARKEIENNAGGLSVGGGSQSPLRTDGGLSNFNRNKASRERAMSRQLLTAQVELLDDIKDEIEKAGVSGGGGGRPNRDNGPMDVATNALAFRGLTSLFSGSIGGVSGLGGLASLLAGPAAITGGVGAPVLPAGAIPDDTMFGEVPDSILTESGRQKRLGPLAGMFRSLTSQDRSGTGTQTRGMNSRGSPGETGPGRSELNITNNIEVQSLDEFRRKLEENKQDILRQVEDEMVQPGDQFAGGHVR